MAVISAQAHVLAKAGGADDRREAAQRLDHAIARASHLIQQLLVLARIDEDRPHAAAEIDLAQLVRQELAQCAPAATARGIDLSLEAPGTLAQPMEVQAFQSVLHNLVDNAIRFGHRGGRVAIDLRVGHRALLLSVVDDGPGIPDGDRELVCNRFFRGIGHDAPGSGLGLAIANQAVLRLGGSVHLVAGLEGRGCCFNVQMPARR